MDDGGHWYRRDGSPCYEVPKKDGGVRPVNLRWDRNLELVPSVTTVLRVVAKPQLERWKQQQVLLAALTLPREADESDNSFIARVMDDSRQQVVEAADEGTRIHDAIECHYKGKRVPEQYEATVAAVVEEVGRLFPGVTDWVSEESFAHPLGFGGKVDLHSPSTGHVIDFKGKDGDFTDGKRLAYDQHWQLAAYHVGLFDRPFITEPCANVFFSRTHPGFVASHKWSVQDMKDGWAIFADALSLWKRLKRYDSGFERREAA